MKPDISVIIPALNEEKNLSSLIKNLEETFLGNNLNAEILIIDDFSDDGTFEESLKLNEKYPNVRAFRKTLPRGIGYAIRFGIQKADGRIGVVVMADAVDPLDTIPLFRQKIIEGGYDLVLLSRYIDRGDSNNIPIIYKLFHVTYRFMYKALLGLKLDDITYAYRAFDLDFIRSLQLESGGFEISPEITIKAYLSKARICEFKGQQGRRLYGDSKFSFFRHGPGYIRVVIKGFLEKFPVSRKRTLLKSRYSG
jgi:dolichol-phosphate mannosyltransferase